MIEYAAKTPTIPIPFHKLLKVVALVDGENPHVRALLELIEAQNFQIEISDRYDRDVSEDAEVGAYIASVDREQRELARRPRLFLDVRGIVQPLPGLQLRSAGRVPGAGGRSHQVLHVRGSRMNFRSRE